MGANRNAARSAAGGARPEERGAPAGAPAPAESPAKRSDDALDSLRQAFNTRLIEDRARFVALREALQARQVPPEAVIAELRNRAHKLRGGAAIFEMRELSAAACALEEAALAASSQVKEGEGMVEAPLGALIDFLTLHTPV